MTGRLDLVGGICVALALAGPFGASTARLFGDLGRLPLGGWPTGSMR
jgi:hypothetical protein